MRDTLLKFNEAIQLKSFDHFYHFISANWQSQVSLQRMSDAFQGFIDQHIDLSPMKDAEISFDEPPRINQEGLLVVHGRSKIPAYQVNFVLSYTYEIPNWRLSGIKLDCLD